MSREAGRGVKGRRPAGFRFTPPGESGWELALDYPLHLVSGGGLGLVERARRTAVQPLDRSEPPEPWKVGGDAEELSTILRYQRYPRDLMDALRESADGLRLDYYPRLEANNWFFPVQVVGVSEELRAEEDPQRFVHGEYQWRELRLRHLQNGEGNCGDSFEQLLTGNLLLSPRLYRDSDGDNVADDWDSFAAAGGSAHGTRAIVDRAQELALDDTTDDGSEEFGVQQQFLGGLEGDLYRVEGEVNVAALGGSAEFRALMDSWDGAFQTTVGSTSVGSVTSGWDLFSFETSSGLSAGAIGFRLRPQVKANAVGDSGTVRIRDLSARLLEEA